MSAPQTLTVRPATLDDSSQMSNLLYYESYVHRHLDWRKPLEWLGEAPFLVAEQDHKVCAVLICPPDPPGVAWVRLFTAARQTNITDAWRALWAAAWDILGQGDTTVAVLSAQPWFNRLLEAQEFEPANRVVHLVWEEGCLPPAPHPAIRLRPMQREDVPAACQVDNLAFDRLWQHSPPALTRGFQHAAYAAVALAGDGQILGYQISTRTPVGGHLARLAVHPRAQRKGIAYALVVDLLAAMDTMGAKRVTVNTQQENLASLALYAKLGFHLTGESTPVYEYRPNIFPGT